MLDLISVGTILNVIIAGSIAIPIGYGLRRTWHKCFTEYDRSLLIRLSEEGDDDHHPVNFHYAPVITGTYPFGELRGKVESNLDSRNVMGFVVGRVRWLDDPESMGRELRNQKPGYYAYCVIQWEHADEVRRYFKQGFSVRKIRIVTESNPRENAFIGFGTEGPCEQAIIHSQGGLRASMCYQPYDKYGFMANDIRMRQLAPQTRILIWVKNWKTKEWNDAWR